MKTKHEDNSFECQECNQKFNRRCNLTRHINSVHKKLDMKKCTECAKLYSDSDSEKVGNLRDIAVLVQLNVEFHVANENWPSPMFMSI